MRFAGNHQGLNEIIGEEIRQALLLIEEAAMVRDALQTRGGISDAGVRERIQSIRGYEPPSNWDPQARLGTGATISPKQMEKRRRRGLMP